MGTRRFAVCMVCALCFTATAWAGTYRPSWPAVRPVQRTYEFPDGNVTVVLPIRTKTGVTLYELFCAGGNSKLTDKHGAFGTDTATYVNPNFGGAFECRLASRNESDGLLVENARQTTEWPSRGRFYIRNLTGACARIPEFGTTRSFTLRGMKITLQVLDPVIVPGRVVTLPEVPGAASAMTIHEPLKSMKLRVTVRPDPSATRAIAAIVPFPKNPPPQCKLSDYFANPAQFSKAERANPRPIDWDAVPRTTAHDWNRDLRVGVRPRHCFTQFNMAATFRGTLVATRLRVHLSQSTGLSLLYALMLKLDHPINICRLHAPRLATTAASMAANELRKLAKTHHAQVSATFMNAARARVRKFINQQKGTSLSHVTSLFLGMWDMEQLGADSLKFVDHRVEVQGFLGAGSALPSNLPNTIVEKICLLKKGKPTACTAYPAWKEKTK